jgi:pimeloyl-ACP methyl ester carboxylesterase
MSRETVMLVHGLWMTGLEMALLGARLRRAGFATGRFRYASRQHDIVAHATRLARTINAAQGVVHLVGHSLGGLVILRALADHTITRPGRIVLLGTPLAGSAAARRLAQHAFGNWLLGASGPRALFEGVAALPAGREVGMIAGNLHVGMGRVVAGLAAPADGAVAVVETRVAGLAAHRVRRCSHSGLLVSARVAGDVIAFLLSGRFTPGDDD